MNRAARVGAFASSSQLLCTAHTWYAAQAQANSRLQQMPVLGSSLGLQSFKGVPGRVEVMQCSLSEAVQPE